MGVKSLAVVLAAGEGTRMQSALPKVLHKIAGLSLVGHVLQTLKASAVSQMAIVVGHKAPEVKKEILAHHTDVRFFYQKDRLGTAHALLAAEEELRKNYDVILVVFGDTPLIRAETLRQAQDLIKEGNDILVFGFYTPSPRGYGRLIVEEGQLVKIVEEKDATAEEKKVTYCNGGVMAIAGDKVLSLLRAVKNNNSKGEFYLTDIIEMAAKAGYKCRTLDVPFEDILGVNTKQELAKAEGLWQNRKRLEVMDCGAVLQMPETVYFSYDTTLEPDVVVEPYVYFGVGVVVKAGACIRAFSHIEGTSLAEQTQIGPYARLRPGCELSSGAKVGNFCELKNAKVGQNTKINHLTYIGDATIGKHTNIGAGTITCNYDGFQKFYTHIGDEVFVGSNTCLVAPVRVQESAYIATGTVVTQDVPAGALAIGRKRQENKPNYAHLLRTHKKNKQ